MGVDNQPNEMKNKITFTLDASRTPIIYYQVDKFACSSTIAQYNVDDKPHL